MAFCEWRFDSFNAKASFCELIFDVAFFLSLFRLFMNGPRVFEGPLITSVYLFLFLRFIDCR